MPWYEFPDCRPMLKHTRNEPLLHLEKHLSLDKMYIDKYRGQYPGSALDRTLVDIRSSLVKAISCVAFGKLAVEWEYEVEARLENSGWLVSRCTKSKPFDLIAFRPGRVPLWIDCKFPRRPPRDVMLSVYRWATENGARYIIPIKKFK